MQDVVYGNVSGVWPLHASLWLPQLADVLFLLLQSRNAISGYFIRVA